MVDIVWDTIEGGKQLIVNRIRVLRVGLLHNLDTGYIPVYCRIWRQPVVANMYSTKKRVLVPKERDLKKMSDVDYINQTWSPK